MSSSGFPYPERDSASLDHARFLSAVKDLSRARDLDAVMKAVRRAARELTGADGVSFVLRERDQVFYADEDAVAPLWKGRRFPTESCISGWAILHRETVAIEDVFTDPRIPAAAYEPTFVKSLAMVPIRTEDPLGAIGAYWASPHRATERELGLLESLAGAAAVAVGNAQLIADLERERARAEAANHAKDEFLAAVSHELRTPLNAILGWARMLRSGAVPLDRRDRALETVERNAQAQVQLVEDLLDFSRIVAGKLRLGTSAVEVTQLVESAVESARPAAVAKGLSLDYEPAGRTATVTGDASRLQQVLANLLGNAVKFTPSGGRVRVRVRVDAATVAVEVSDDGRGIDPGFLPHVFDRFRQADAGPSRTQGGLGLGLTIARHLVDLHLGRIEAFSEGPGRGARFVVHLPLAIAPAPSESKTHGSFAWAGHTLACPPEVSGLRVLVVDDETDNCELVAGILEHCGARVSTARSVREALAAIDAATPDVLVSDIGMPDQNGYDLIRAVRARGDAAGGRVPAVALTAYAQQEDRARAMIAGFDNHITKPVEPVELLAVIANLVGRLGPR